MEKTQLIEITVMIVMRTTVLLMLMVMMKVMMKVVVVKVTKMTIMMVNGDQGDYCEDDDDEEYDHLRSFGPSRERPSEQEYTAFPPSTFGNHLCHWDFHKIVILVIVVIALPVSLPIIPNVNKYS